jgi:acyl carrier protein
MSNTIKEQVQHIFQDIFDDPGLQVETETTANDVEEWDSLTHINLIVAIEKAFKIRFTTAEVTGMKNVGDLLSAIARKTG